MAFPYSDSLSGTSKLRSRMSAGNVIVLTSEFYREVTAHPIPTDLQAAKALSCAPAALDLLTWLSYRCFIAKGEERIRLFGEFGLRAKGIDANAARGLK